MTVELGWLTPDGTFYSCGYGDHRLTAELAVGQQYESWADARDDDGLPLIDLERYCEEVLGWWKKALPSGVSKPVWCGAKNATPAQRRYINRDVGQRMSNDFYEGFGVSQDLSAKPKVGPIECVYIPEDGPALGFQPEPEPEPEPETPSVGPLDLDVVSAVSVLVRDGEIRLGQTYSETFYTAAVDVDGGDGPSGSIQYGMDGRVVAKVGDKRFVIATQDLWQAFVEIAHGT